MTANAIERRFNDNPSSYHSININRFCTREKKLHARIAHKKRWYWTSKYHLDGYTIKVNMHRAKWRASECPCKQHHDRNDANNPIKIEINSKHLMRDVIHFFPGSHCECTMRFRSIVCRCVWLQLQVTWAFGVNKIGINSVSMFNLWRNNFFIRDIVGVNLCISRRNNGVAHFFWIDR